MQFLQFFPTRAWRRTVLLSGVVGATASATSVAGSQQAPDTLQQVHVTVLRTSLDVTAAPFSIAVVGTRDATAARPGFALDEVLGRLAGIQTDDRFNFALGERIAIRGIGARAQFGVRGIRLLVDDIPATLADGQSALNNVDLGSLGGAEVIRGPASALYGNASGGVVALTTAAAPNTLFAATSRVLAGGNGLRRIQFGGGGTSGAASYVLNAGRLDYDGYRAHSEARNAHANLVAGYTAQRASFKFVANAVQYDALNPGSLSDSLVHVDRDAAFATNVAQQTGERGRQLQLGTSAHAQLGVGELRMSIYELHRSLDNPIPPRVIALSRNAGGVRAAYVVSRPLQGTDVTAIAGVESDLQHDDRQNYTNTAGTRGALVLDQLERVTSVSPFLQLTVTAGPVTTLAAIRHDHFRFAVDDRFVTATDPDDSGERRLSALTPTLGVTWHLTRSLNVYGNVAGAFQTPTTTELANRPDGAGGFNPSLDPERTRSAEFGLNGVTYGGIVFHTAAYRMRVRDVLIPFEVTSSPGRQFYRNAGAAIHRGAEAEVSVPVAPLVMTHLSYTYTDARYQAYTLAGTSYAHNREAGVAPHLFNASIDVGTASDRFVSLGLRTQSSTFVNDANSAHSPGYAVADIRGALPVVHRLSLMGGISNLADVQYNTSVTINAAAGRYYEPGPGRTAYLGVQLGPSNLTSAMHR